MLILGKIQKEIDDIRIDNVFVLRFIKLIDVEENSGDLIDLIL